MQNSNILTLSHFKMRPIDLFKRVRTLFSDCAILESLDKDIDTNRYSIVGVIPLLSLKELDGLCHLHNFPTNKNTHVNWQSTLPLFTSLNTDNNGPQLGTIGYIGYEKNKDFNQVKTSPKQTISMPDSYLVKYSLMYWWDHQTNQGYWVHDEQTTRSDIEQLCKKIMSLDDLEDEKFNLLGDIESGITEQQYLNSIEKTLEYIRQGDIFQANVTSRYSGAYIGDPFSLYLQLRQSTPNPFFAYLDIYYPVISTSPERFFRVSNGIIDAYTINNTMIVDLMSNDLKKICEKGSIKIPDLCVSKKFNHSLNLGTKIQGKLNPDTSVLQILKAIFPAGSVTGIPKNKAMEVIDKIEPFPRKIYCGSIGFFGAEGYIDTSVAIRTLYFDDSQVYFHSDGGIITDSTTKDELQTLKVKVQSILSVLNQNNILQPLRLQLDELDQQLLEVIALRMDLVKQVGLIKDKYQIPLMQSNRVYNMKLERKQLSRKLGLPYGFTDNLFDLLIETAMKLEEKLED